MAAAEEESDEVISDFSDLEGETKEENVHVSCPVCQNNISPDFINKHLDTCLRSQNGALNRTPTSTSSKIGTNVPSPQPRSFFNQQYLMKRARHESESSSRKSRHSKSGETVSSTKSPKSNASSSTINSFLRLPVAEKCETKTIGGSNGLSKRPKSESPEFMSVIPTPVRPKPPVFMPLAEQMRPTDFDEFEGQESVLGPNCILRKLLEAQDVPSMILWGPPGCGKTSLVHVIATSCKVKKSCRFVKMSATSSGVKDVKEAVDKAKSDQTMFKRKTILFIDEIHRFNKLQQDIFLPHVETGTIILIGATTENPSFSLNSALLSRCRVFVMEKLSMDNMERILKRALDRSNVNVCPDDSDTNNILSGRGITESAVSFLSGFCDGDARTALNGLQMALASKQVTDGIENPLATFIISVDDIKESLQRSHVLYDRKGDQHYDIISAYIKSMRGSDADAALYWLARMLAGGEDPRFVARRLVIFASEDIGMADGNALNLASSTYASCQNVGMPECKLNLAHCTVYMARAPKSRACCDAYMKAEECVKNQEGSLPAVPLHLRNAPTRLMKDLGYSKGYKMYAKNGVDLPYLPEGIPKFL